MWCQTLGRRCLSSFKKPFGLTNQQFAPETFWKQASEDVVFFEKKGNVYDPERKKWFAEYTMNTSYNCVDRHILRGYGARPALFYDSPYTQTQTEWTYAHLHKEVSEMAAAMQEAGVQKGDRVLLYMPTMPQSVVGMLASARIGAVHVVVFAGYSALELAKRIQHCSPKLILSASCGVEPMGKCIPYHPVVQEALRLVQSCTVKDHVDQVVNPPTLPSPSPLCVFVQRPQCMASLDVCNREYEWDEFVRTYGKGKQAACVAVQGSDPLYILYTSGTTGQPKGIVRDNAGHAVMGYSYMRTCFEPVAQEKEDVSQPQPVYWAYSDLGWLTGHSGTVYGPLFTGAATILFEGKPVPDPGAMFRVVEQYKPSTVVTAPTVYRMIRRFDPDGTIARSYDLHSLKSLVTTGERMDAPTRAWIRSLFPKRNVPIWEQYGMTETGWPIMGVSKHSSMVVAPPDGSMAHPLPGNLVDVLDEQGQSYTCGSLCIRLPLPPGYLSDCWNDRTRYQDYFTKFPGYFYTADLVSRDAAGHIFYETRADDVLKVSGRRVSAEQMEDVLGSHPSVAECVVLGRDDAIKGQVPFALCVLKKNNQKEVDNAQLELECMELVRRRMGAFVSLQRVVMVPELPKNRTGKVLRSLLRSIVNRRPYTVLENPSLVSSIVQALQEQKCL